MPSETQVDLDLPFLVLKLWMTRIRNFLLHRQGRPRAQLGKRSNEMPSEKQVDLDMDLPFLVLKLWMTRIRNFLLHRQGRPRAQLGKRSNEMPSEKQVDRDLDLPFLVRKLWMGLKRGAFEKNLIGIPREPLKLVDLLPPVLAPTVLLVLRLVLRVRVAKIAAVTKLRDLVHRDQRTKR
jgi:hypothetical protein